MGLQENLPTGAPGLTIYVVTNVLGIEDVIRRNTFNTSNLWNFKLNLNTTVSVGLPGASGIPNPTLKAWFL